MENDNKKLLFFVEDERDIAALYRFTFERYGFAVDISETGTEALQKLNAFVADKKTLPAALILDILLPDRISGMDVMRAVRKMPEYDNTPIVMFTNYSSDEFRAEIEAAKNVAYVLKLEATPKQLVAQIKNLLGMRD